MKTESSGESPITHILDTSAVIAHLAAEPGGKRLIAIRSSSALPFVVLTELYYVTYRKVGPVLADKTIEHVLSWKLPLLRADQRLSLLAGTVKSRYALGLADSYIAAFAIDSYTTLVTKDPDFRVLRPELKLLEL